LRVAGVGDVRVFGASDYAMRIWVNPDVLATLGLTIADVSRAVQRQSTVNPAGQLGGQPSPPGQVFTYTIRTKGRLVTAEAFGQVIVRANPDGSFVRLKDIARVDLGSETYSQVGRFGGKNAAVLGVYQLPASNALDVSRRLRVAMESARRRFPPDMETAVAIDSTAPVQEGIKEILVTLLEALALVIVVVYMFLQSWRATLIPLLTVPVSLLGAFIFFPLFGFSINTLSLFGLVLGWWCWCSSASAPPSPDGRCRSASSPRRTRASCTANCSSPTRPRCSGRTRPCARWSRCCPPPRASPATRRFRGSASSTRPPPATRV
jgi:HAE1 family hydrophobic/amphiphilic exporter-1